MAQSRTSGHSIKLSGGDDIRKVTPTEWSKSETETVIGPHSFKRSSSSREKQLGTFKHLVDVPLSGRASGG